MVSYSLTITIVLAILATSNLASAAISIKDGALSLVETDGMVTHTEKLVLNKKSTEGLTLDHTQELKASFKVLGPSSSEMVPEQALVMLKSSASGKSAFFAPSSQKSDIEIVITSDGIAKQLGTQGGEFEASLIIGSSSPKIAVKWVFAIVNVLHRQGQDGNQPPAPRTILETLSNPKPEIVHQHRLPAKRAPAIISLVFTGVSITPLLIFLSLITQSGINIEAIATSAFHNFYSFGFHAGIAGILAVDLIFWIGLNLMKTAPILLVLELITFWFGVKAASKVKIAAVAVPASSDSSRSKQE